jgi:hypothetical protein
MPKALSSLGSGVAREDEGMRSILLLAAAVILVRDPTGKWASDPLQPWFESLRNKLGLYCCAKADGNALDDGEWDMKDNNYRVFVRPTPKGRQPVREQVS